MSRPMLAPVFRKLRVRKAGGVLLLLAALPLGGFAQNAPAKSAARPPATLQTMAQDLVQELSARKKVKVMVLDFGGPDTYGTPFGAYLAAQFALELAKIPSNLILVDRLQLPGALRSLHLVPEAAPDYYNDKALAKKVGAQCVVGGVYGESNGGLGITLTVDCSKAPFAAPPAINRRIAFSPEMAERLGAPLASLRPNGEPHYSVANGLDQKDATGGPSYPACEYCPQAPYNHEAVAGIQQGTVLLVAVISAEGRATNIQVIKAIGYGLDQSAVSAISTWRFKPAHDASGGAVPVRQTIEVTFHLY